MKKSDLIKMVREAVKSSLKEVSEWHPDSERDEQAYADHVRDLETGVSDDHLGDAEELLMGVGQKLRSAKEHGVDPEVIAQAVQHIEEAGKILDQAGMMEEGMDRSTLIGSAQALAKRIATRISFSPLPDGALSAMVANLQSIANKL